MKLEITRELKNPTDDLHEIIEYIDDGASIWLTYSQAIFAYISNQICWILYYKKSFDEISLEWLYVHEKLSINEEWKSYHIWSRLMHEIMTTKYFKNIELYSSCEAIWFYKNLGFISSWYMRWFKSWDNLSQIKKNLEDRLKSPRYLELTQEDLVRLWIISKKLETGS